MTCIYKDYESIQNNILMRKVSSNSAVQITLKAFLNASNSVPVTKYKNNLHLISCFMIQDCVHTTRRLMHKEMVRKKTF